MKQDYLWDKSGADPEIEELENALSAFRYQETAPPALPAKVLAFPERAVEKTVRRLFSFRFALAACAAVVLITFGVLFQFSGGKTVTETDLAQTSSINEESNKEIIEESINEAQINSIAESENFTLANVETSPQIEVSKQIIKQFEKTLAMNKPNGVKIRRSVSNQNKTNARNAEIKNPTPATLTAEEKQAYEQLMLALSITSSKLKIVKDKVDGVEEQNAVFKDGR
ncbi:MAG TPA: hypothetical protein VF692_07605 [Pyrinomonadaceae bacterium]|jgi:cytoskeletal protein RodZ